MTNKELSDTGGTLVSPGVAAEKLHVTTKTLQRMATRGEISAVVLPSGHRRYRVAEVDAILAESSEGDA